MCYIEKERKCSFENALAENGVSKNMPSCHFLLIVISVESSLKIQKRAESFKDSASLTFDISLLGYSMVILRLFGYKVSGW